MLDLIAFIFLLLLLLHCTCFVFLHLPLCLPFACSCLFARPTRAAMAADPHRVHRSLGTAHGYLQRQGPHLRHAPGETGWGVLASGMVAPASRSRSTTAHAALQASPLHGHTVLSPATRLPTAHPSDKTGYTYDPTNTTEGASRRRARRWMPGFRDPPATLACACSTNILHASPMLALLCLLACPLRTFSHSTLFSFYFVVLLFVLVIDL